MTERRPDWRNEAGVWSTGEPTVPLPTTRLVISPSLLYRRAVRMALITEGLPFVEHRGGVFVVDTLTPDHRARARHVVDFYGL